MSFLTHHAWHEFYVDNDDDTPLLLVPDGPGDVTSFASIMYAVSESAGGTSAGGTTCVPGAAVNLYDDGVDVFTLSIAADGEVTVARSAGASTFDAKIHLVWV